MEVVLHLGAHKTGSSWVQAALKGSAPALVQAGVVAPTTPRVRSDVTAPAMAGAPVDLAAFGPGRRLILSDENMLGTPRQMLRTGRLYPKAVARLRALRAALSGCEVSLMLATRPLAPVFAGLVVEGARNGFIRPLEVVEAALLSQTGGWKELAARLRDTWPEAKLTLWEQAPLGTAFLDALAGAPVAWSLPTEPVRRGPRHDAVMAALVAAQTGKASPSALSTPRGPTEPGFDPWSAALYAHLAARDRA